MRIVPMALSAFLVGSAVLCAGAGTAAATPKHHVHIVTGGGTFGPYRPDAPAVRYNTELVPDGAKAYVFSVSAPKFGTATALAVSGLVPGHEYGAHVHTNACGPAPADSGPHYQNVQDPVSPSVDPAYANPRNEIWLDFTADANGKGLAFSKVGWHFGERRAKSVVIHERHTRTDPGHAGDAGARVACVNVAF